MNKSKRIGRQLLCLIIAFVMVLTLIPRMPASLAYADAGQVPDHSKTREANGDGTYKLSLDVTGDADTEKPTAKANILIVYDVSGSMDDDTYKYTETTGTTGEQYGYFNGGYNRIYYRNGAWRQSNNNYGTVYNGIRYTRTTLSRGDAAEKVVYDFSDALFAYNKTADADNVEMALVAFSSERRNGNYNSGGYTGNPGNGTTAAWEVEGWTTDKNAYLDNFSSTGNNNSAKMLYGGGTNWEAAMQRTLSVLGEADADPTYVVFVTDGLPTFYVTGGNGYSTTTAEYRAPEGEVVQIENYNTANHTYNVPADSNTTLYGIFAFGGTEDRLDDLIYYAQNGTRRETQGSTATPNYYNATDQAALSQAISDIFATIAETLGIGSVAITDGTTTNVQTDQGVSHLLAVEPDTYDYWLTLPVSGSGPYTATRKDLVTSEDYTITFTAADDGSYTATWTDSTGAHEVTGIEGSVSMGKFKYRWTESNDLYKFAPPEAYYDDATSSVKWDLSPVGTLLDGVTYTVTFNVYPTQETYDMIADLENGDLEYDDLDPNIQKYLKQETDGSFTLETNTTTDLSYVDTRVDDTVHHTQFENPPRVATAVEKMDITKRWFNDLDWRGQEQYASGFKMDVLRDGTKCDEVEVKPDDWSDEIFISTGLMRVHRNDDGQITSIEVLDTGHDYTLREPENMTEHWELVIETLHPMLVNGELHSLVQVKDEDIPEGMGDADFYTLEGVDFYRIGSKVFEDNGPNDNDTASVSAYNERKSNLNITKTITGNADVAPEDALFTYTLSLTDVNGDDIWFSVVTDPDNPDETLVKDLDTTATAEEGDTGYFYFPSGSSVTVKMQAGWNLRIINIPTYSTYSVEESETMDPGFTFDSIDGTTEFRVGGLPDGAVDLGNNKFSYDGVIYTKVSDTEYTAVYEPTITGMKVEGKVVSPNAPYQVTFDNKYTPTKVTPKATKEVTGWDAAWGNSEAFTFSIEAGDNATTQAIADGYVVMPDPATASTAAGLADGQSETVTFGDITFNRTGTYTFTVKETNANAPDGWTYANAAADAKTITVVIGTDEDGNLTATSVTGNNPIFENSYEAEPTTAQIPVKKNVTPANSGANDITGKFTFTLAAGTNTAGDGVTTPMPSSNTVLCGADGAEVKFGEIEFSAPGTYTYTVKESVTGDDTATSVDGISLETAEPKTITVVVTDDGSGTLKAVVNGGVTLEFNNPYRTSELPITIPVEKILDYDESLTPPDITGEFTFTIATTDNAPLPETKTLTNPSATGGNMTFGDEETTGKIIITSPGIYTYTITESGNVPGITNADPATQTVIVTVSDNGDGTLGAEYSIEKASFTNTYTVDPVPASIPVEKILTYDEGLTPPDITEKFTFTLTAGTNTAGVTTPMPQVTEHTNPDADGGDMTFGDITFNKPGTYNYTVTETGTVAGVSPVGDTSKNVTITVVDNGNGTMTATVNDGQKLQFTNEYRVGNATAEIPVEKILNVPQGLTPGSIADKFTFTLAAGTNTAGEDVETPMPQTTSYTNPSPTGGTVTFGGTDDPITYTKPGTYNYTVTESGSAPGVTNDATATKNVTVVVTDNGDGTMTATVNDGETLEFTNTYNVEPTTVEFPAKKILSVPAGSTGPDITGKYTIALAAGTNTAGEGVATPMPTVTSYPNPDRDGGVVTFGGTDDPITYTKPGTYNYTVSESGTVSGVSNDSSAAGKTVTVTVVDNGNGTLTATADSTAANPVTFTNTYSYGKITATPAVHKTLAYDAGLTPPDITEEYTFTLAAGTNTAGEGVVTPMPPAGGETVKNPASDGGTESFGTIEFTAPGVYNYSVTESGTVDGVTNDTVSPKTFTITVTDMLDGTLEAVIDYGNDEGHVTFTNTYTVEPVTAEIPVEKILSVPQGLTPDSIADKFTFTLAAGTNTAGEGVATPMPGTTSYTNPDADGGDITFGGEDDPITFTKPGTYNYTVTESGSAPGVTNDTTATKGVTVVVTDNGNGTMSATVNDGETLEFTNTYNVEPVTAEIPVEKNLVVPAGLEGPEEWEYTITAAAQNGAPVAASMSGKVDQDNESITFGPITYTAPGTYTYNITEAGEVDGVTNDTVSPKVFTVEVEDNGDGTLTATPSATAAAPVIFTNTYGVEPVTAEIPVEKNLVVPAGLEGPEEWEYTITAAAQNGAPVAASMSGKVDQDNESITFGPITYTAPGTYTYNITEAGEVDGVTNDTVSPKVVTVEVEDNGDGTLTATPSATAAAPVVFTNTYGVEPKNVTPNLSKTVDKMQPGVDSVTFDFTIAAVTEGAPLPQKEDKDNTAASVEFTKAETKAIDFGAITFTKPGTYEYTLTEVLDDLDGGWVVTGSPAAVTIVVTDNKDGTMNAETSAVVIKNTFDTVKVEGEKKWNDEEYFDEDGEPIEGYERPDITVNLLADGQKIDSVVTTADDNWKFSFTDLPKYKDHGTEIVYTVTEDEVTAFEGEIDGYVIDNTPKRLDEDQLNPTELTIKKVDAETGNVIPTGATFVLKKGETEIEYTTGEDGTVVIPFAQGGNEDGTYTLYEKKAPEGYTASDKTYTIVVDKEFDHVEIKENLWTWFYNLIFGDKTKAEFDEDTQTLTVENPPVKVKVEATKVWNDNNDKDKKRPDSITLTLTGTTGDKEVFTDTKTVTAKDSWKTAWTDLASYVDGEEVVFELTEAAIAGYTTDEIKVVKGEDGNYTVTVKNNHQSEPLKEVFSGSSTTNIDGQVVEPGQELTYKITYVNTTGATAETVIITDKIPEYTEFVSADNGGTEKDGTVTWTMSNVADEKEIVVQFVVKVKDDVNGQAVKNKAVVNDGTNDYETNEVVNRTPVKHDPPVKKIVKGEGADPNDEFKFSIEALYNTAGVSQMPMPNDASGKIAYTTAKAGETKEFGWITFTEPGTYVYEVKEVNNGLKNYKYDSTSYKLTYELASNDGDLKMTLTVTRNGAKYDHSAFEFENVYEPPVKTGDTTIIGEYVVIFFASIVLLLMILFRRRRAEEK